MNKLQNCFAKYSTVPAFVLDGCAPNDVARAMIEGGKQKEPFYIFDMDEAYRRIEHFKSMMPRVKIFYAMKCNDSEMMLKLAIALGVGFDCASPGEIYKIRQLNIHPESIIYAMPTKTPDQMIFARDSGVKHTTFDSSYELRKIKQYWQDARLLIRIRVDGDSLYKLGDKFGCDFETDAIDLLELAANLGLNVVGVAFHVGSACSSNDSYVLGLTRAKVLFDHEARAGRKMRIVDIGGGFLSNTTDVINQASKLINRTLNELFPDSNVQIIAEPGRYLCESSTKLYCNISNTRLVTRGNKTVNMIYINDGVYGTLRYPETWHTVSKFKRTTEIASDDVEIAILWGPSCDSRDSPMKDFTIYLPRCTPLDWLVFDMQGAYTFTFSTRFSCLEIPLIRPVVSMDLWCKIKQRDIFSRTDFLIKPDISAPLPKTLPVPLLYNENKNCHLPTLI